MILGWLKKKARETSLRNIRKLLWELVEVSNEADALMREHPFAAPQDWSRGKVRRLQDSLILQLIGPLPFDRVRSDIIDPILREQGITEGARMAVEHVCNYVQTQNHHWSQEDYEAYDEIVKRR
jgi:hypothetical protein